MYRTVLPSALQQMGQASTVVVLRQQVGIMSFKSSSTTDGDRLGRKLFLHIYNALTGPSQSSLRSGMANLKHTCHRCYGKLLCVARDRQVREQKVGWVTQREGAGLISSTAPRKVDCH